MIPLTPAQGSKSNSIAGEFVVIDASIGIVVAPMDGTDTDQLLANEDLALYHAKRSGGGHHRCFDVDAMRLPRGGRTGQR